MSDDQLLELLLTVDHKHFSLLTKCYDQYIYSKCKSYVEDPEAAADDLPGGLY